MVDEVALREVLLVILRQIKFNCELIAVTQVELAALRETVRGLDPTFGEILEQQRNNLRSRAIEPYQAALHGFDQMIQRLEAGYVC